MTVSTTGIDARILREGLSSEPRINDVWNDQLSGRIYVKRSKLR